MSNDPQPTEEFKANSTPGKAEVTSTYNLEQTTAPGLFCAVAFPPGSLERIEYFEKAMISLRLGVEFGYRDWEYLENDEDFDPMLEWPEFQRAIDEWKVQFAKKW